MITDVITERELYWAAGFLEGEGTFYFDKRVCTIRAPQTIKEPLARLQKLFGGEIYFRKRNQPTHADQWVFRINGRLAAAISMMLYPLMTCKRKDQIAKMLTNWRNYEGAPKIACRNGHNYLTTEHKIYWMLSRSGKLVRRRHCILCRRLRAHG